MIEKQKIIADSSACIAASTLLGAGMGGLTVLSLFDGMSCGQLALQKAGIKVKQYYAAYSLPGKPGKQNRPGMDQ